MKQDFEIRPWCIEHLNEYAKLYAAAFSCPPWNSHWTVENAAIHIQELMERRHSYGLECIKNHTVVGYLGAASILLDFGRLYEINDVAVDPNMHRQGIGTAMVEQAVADLKQRGVGDISLITFPTGHLPKFYEKCGFKKENRLLMMHVN